MKGLVVVVLFAGLACGAELPEPQEEVDVESETPESVEPAELPPMPDFPAPRSGALSAISAGPHIINGAWEAKAGLCEDPATLQVIAEVPGTGTLVLLQLLPSGERVGEYPIAFSNPAEPGPPVAQIGVQLFRDTEAHGFQATDGMVELYSFGEHVSGRFAVTIREIQSSALTQYAGTFAGVAIERLAPDYCERLKTTMAEFRPVSGVP